VVLWVPPDDGGAHLLWSELLHPQVHVPATTDPGACVQLVLHHSAPKPCCRDPAVGATILHLSWRTGNESCWEHHGNGFPSPTQYTPGRHDLSTPSLLLQHAPPSYEQVGKHK
jgi:hypothetical protein